MKNTTKPFMIGLTCLGVMLGACSGSSSPTGPRANAGNPEVFDNVTIAFQSLAVVHDCDYGSKGSGDFYYDFYVDRVDSTGNWTQIAHFSADNVKISEGSTHSFSNHVVTVMMKRNASQSLRVRMYLTEEDDLSTDLDVSTLINHKEAAGWLPGTQTWNINLREPSFLSSGCKMTLTYSASVTPV